MRHCFSSTYFGSALKPVHLKTPMTCSGIWNMFRGVQGSLTCEIRWHRHKQMHTHTHTDLWAMRFILPTLSTTLIHQKPSSPHTQCGMVTALWLRDRDAKWEKQKERWMKGGGGAGMLQGSLWWAVKGRASQVTVGDVWKWKLSAYTSSRPDEDAHTHEELTSRHNKFLCRSSESPV